MLMSRIGQKKTVLLSLLVTFASLLLPVFGDSYMLMLISFSLLGIGNALMQTSLNPLLSNIVRGDRLASSLTFGQFVKAIASFLAPYIAMWGSDASYSVFRFGLADSFPGLYGKWPLSPFFCSTPRRLKKRKGRRQTVYFRTMPCLARQAVYPALLYRYHVSCRYRRGHKHYRPEDFNGAHRNGIG